MVFGTWFSWPARLSAPTTNLSRRAPPSAPTAGPSRRERLFERPWRTYSQNCASFEPERGWSLRETCPSCGRGLEAGVAERLSPKYCEKRRKGVAARAGARLDGDGALIDGDC